MKTKPKKTVTAWAYHINYRSYPTIGYSFADVRSWRRSDVARGWACGPIVKIALPLPKEKKR